MELKESSSLTSGYTKKDTVYQDSMLVKQKQKYRPMEQGRKPRDTNTHTYGHLIFDKECKSI